MSEIELIVETWEKMPISDKEYTLELLHKELNDSKRNELLIRAKEAELNYSNKNVQIGSANDLFLEIEND